MEMESRDREKRYINSGHNVLVETCTIGTDVSNISLYPASKIEFAVHRITQHT